MTSTPARLGVMLYTVLEQALADLDGTLERIAGLGFGGVETYGVVERLGASRVRTAIAASGLVLTSAHTPFPAADAADRLLDENEELGARFLVWSLEQEEFATPAAVRAGVARVNEAAERAADRGMTIVYHNHSAEFSQRFGDRQAYDLLLEELDPRVEIELDGYWAARGGADLAEVVRRLGDRVRFIHLRDGIARDGGQDDLLVPVGRGDVDWVSALRQRSGIRWQLLELERLTVDPFDALADSAAYLTGLGLSRLDAPAAQ